MIRIGPPAPSDFTPTDAWQPIVSPSNGYLLLFAGLMLFAAHLALFQLFCDGEPTIWHALAAPFVLILSTSSHTGRPTRAWAPPKTA